MKDNLDYQEIGNRIQEARRAKNMTQEALADVIESSQKYVSKIENGSYKLHFGTAVTLAEALQIPVTALIADYDNSRDENTLKLLMDDIRSLNAKQLNALREIIPVIKKM